jgi:hypothetical protein
MAMGALDFDLWGSMDGFRWVRWIRFHRIRYGHSVPNSTMAFGRPSIPTVPFRRFRFRFDAIPIRCNSDSMQFRCCNPLLPFFDSDRSIPTVLTPTRCNSDTRFQPLLPFPCSSHEYFDIVIHSICAHKKGPIFDTIISAHKKGAHTIIFDTTILTTSYISKFQVCVAVASVLL